MPKTLGDYADSDKARAYRNRQRAINYARCPGDPGVSGSRWNEDEKRMVLEHAMSDREISERIGRSVRSIQKMRYRLRRGEL